MLFVYIFEETLQGGLKIWIFFSRVKSSLLIRYAPSEYHEEAAQQVPTVSIYQTSE